MMIGKADTADILAGRYVDGTWSYTQALYEDVYKRQASWKSASTVRKVR